jgi:hypothetical protein
MSLENFAHFNDISPKLRLELERKVESFGKRVRYKFDIAKPNPDPEKYNGAFVKDELPAKLKNGFYIINLNGQSHWTAMLKHGKKYYYFDSFGFPAPTDIENKIPKEYIYSEKHIQTEPTSSCGFYVVAFIKYMNEHKNKQVAYEDFINSFEVDSNRNEGILKKYFLE